MHKLLAKQLAKATDGTGSVDLAKLIDLVDAAYEEFDRDRRRTDRSMSLMIEELEAVHRNLEQTVVERTGELRASEAIARRKEVQLDAALNHIVQGLCMFDAEARIVLFNRRYCELMGEDGVGLEGVSHLDLLKNRKAQGRFVGDPDEVVRTLAAHIRAGEISVNETRGRGGAILRVVRHPMEGGGWVATFEDITEQRQVEVKIAHMARHDALTDLPNRVLLRERLNEALVQVERGQQLAILYLDLDQFKNVNDSLGHPTGDELLRVVGGRLRSCVKDSDTVSRVGGDEFCIIQMGIRDAADAEHLAERIADAIKAPYDLHGHPIMIDVSIGIALAPTDGKDANELLKNADIALYGAKTGGRGVFRFFEIDMDARMKERRALELALRKAFENDEFELYYQPMLNLNAGAVRCCEALLRWHHPDRGMVSPAEFIAVAEEIGLIVALGERVIRRACEDAARWPDDVCVAVNLSPTQLASKGLLQIVVSALAMSGLSPHRLELEITEAVLMQNSDATLQTLHQLRALGIRISMDDFGTGYSSLSYLRSFPFDNIKIDRCFIKGLGESTEAGAIVQAVADLADSLGMTTTAEGVETRQQLDLVRNLGCTDVQGFFYSPPVPMRELVGMLAERSGAKIAAA